MRLLLKDMLRRKFRWPFAVFALSAMGYWWAAGWHHDSAGVMQRAFRASLVAAFLLGPLLIAFAPEPRAVWHMPISRRDHWRATWLLATVGPTLILGTGKLLGLLFTPGPGWLNFLSSVSLSAVYDFVYTGIACGGIIVLARSRHARPSAWLLLPRLVVIIPMALLVGGGMLWPYLFRNRLPIRWSDLAPLSGTTLAAGLTIAVATYFHTAQPPAPGSWTRAAPGSGSTTRRPPFDWMHGLTGLWRLLAREYLFSIGLGAFLVLTSGLLVFVAGTFMQSSEGDGGFLAMQHLLLFDPSLTVQRGQVFDLLIWLALFVTTLVSRFPEIIRHLRVLPVGALRLNLLLVLWPALMVLTIWMALLALHLAVLGTPVGSLRPGLFLALVGASAIARSVTLRWPRLSSWFFIFVISGGPMVRMVDDISAWWFVALGLAGIAAAAVLNHSTLTRSATYRTRTPKQAAMQPHWS